MRHITNADIGFLIILPRTQRLETNHLTERGYIVRTANLYTTRIRFLKEVLQALKDYSPSLYDSGTK